MLRFLVLLLHNLIYPPALLLMAPAALRKMRVRGGKWSGIRQRLGFFDHELAGKIAGLTSRRRVWWMHAVSVGEIGVAAKLIRELQRRDDAPGIVLSTTTPTGFAEAQKLAAEFPDQVYVIYNPLDLWFTVRRCLNLIRPERIVLVEAEVWPNLVFAARSRGIEVTLVNARLSPRSQRRYGYVLPLVRPVFSMLTRVFVQEPDDAARWESLGVSKQSLICVGSIKYDTAGQQQAWAGTDDFGHMLQHIRWSADDPVLLGASTHAGEEMALAVMFREMRVRTPQLRLILVPRHAERCGKIDAELQQAGFTVVRRTLLEDQRARSADGLPEILLVDTTGELRAWLRHASLVVIGKSFMGRGGQNPAEAIMARKPVLFGPHMENFTPLVRQLLAANGALQFADFNELQACASRLLQDHAASEALAQSGARALRIHEGATSRTVDVLLGRKSPEKERE